MTLFANRAFAPHPLAPQAHFSKNRLVSRRESNPQSGHAQRMSCLHCELFEILEQTRPLDNELVDLIEQAYQEGQIDGHQADLAHLWLLTNINDLYRVARH